MSAALQHTAELAETESLERVRDSIDPRWITEALEATGTATLRKRRLSAEQVVWLVLGMALQRDRPITEVVSKLDLALPDRDGSAVVAPSSVVQARKRLGSEPLRWLFEKSAETWSDAGERFRGLALYGADGSTLRIADADENRRGPTWVSRSGRRNPHRPFRLRKRNRGGRSAGASPLGVTKTELGWGMRFSRETGPPE